jgi:hypothetical protein
MNLKSKLNKIVIVLSIILFTITIIFCLFPQLFVCLISLIPDWSIYQVVDFEDNYPHFQTVAKIAEKEINEDDECSYLSNGGDGEPGLFNPNTNSQVKLSEEEKHSISCVSACFTNYDAKWDTVYKEGDFIEFRTTKGLYLVIYSENGEKPTYLNNGKNHYFIKRLNKNWYHALKDPNS